MPDHAAGRVDLRGRDLEERGLAGAVGAEDDPALVLLHRPVDPVEQDRRPVDRASTDADVGELEHGGHGAHPSRPAPARPEVASTAVTSPPDAARLAWWGTAWLRGLVVTDLFLDAVTGADAVHEVRDVAGAARR